MLLAAFGNFYSIYINYTKDGGAPICRLLKYGCFTITIIIIMIAVLNTVLLMSLFTVIYEALSLIVLISLHLIIALLALPAMIIAYGMYKDGST